jgi:ribonuclease HI
VQDYVKLNVDASFDADDLRGATGAIIRDSHGSFVVACSTKLKYVHNAFSAEIHALKQGLLLAKSIGCNRLICCSGNLDVIQAMQEGGYSSSVATPTLDDCYHLASDFLKIQL